HALAHRRLVAFRETLLVRRRKATTVGGARFAPFKTRRLAFSCTMCETLRTDTNKQPPERKEQQQQTVLSTAGDVFSRICNSFTPSVASSSSSSSSSSASSSAL